MANDHVVQYPLEHSLCTGCMSCEMLCSIAHDGVVSSQRAGIKLGVGPIKTMMHTVYVCQQCDDHPCHDACPRKDDAMCIDERGIVYVRRERCIGCGKCVRACPFDPPRVHVVRRDGERFAVKCDLCRDVEGGPVCVKNCPAMVLGLSSIAPEHLSAFINA